MQKMMLYQNKSNAKSSSLECLKVGLEAKKGISRVQNEESVHLS